MCISRSNTEMCLPLSSVQAHLPGYPRRLVKMWGHILTSSYCSRKASMLKHQSVYVTSAPWISRVEDRHIQSHGCQPFPLPTPSVASVPTLVAHSLTRSGVSIRVWCSPVWGGGGQPPSTNHSALGLWWPSVWLHCPSMAGESCLSLFFHSRGSPILLRCTPHQLARGVRLPVHSNWCIMGRVLSLTSEPLAVGGSDRPLPHLHQGEATNIEVGRV